MMITAESVHGNFPSILFNALELLMALKLHSLAAGEDFGRSAHMSIYKFILMLCEVKLCEQQWWWWFRRQRGWKKGEAAADPSTRHKTEHIVVILMDLCQCNNTWKHFLVPACKVFKFIRSRSFFDWKGFLFQSKNHFRMESFLCAPRVIWFLDHLRTNMILRKANERVLSPCTAEIFHNDNGFISIRLTRPIATWFVPFAEWIHCLSSGTTFKRLILHNFFLHSPQHQSVVVIAIAGTQLSWRSKYDTQMCIFLSLWLEAICHFDYTRWRAEKVIYGEVAIHYANVWY